MREALIIVLTIFVASLFLEFLSARFTRPMYSRNEIKKLRKEIEEIKSALEPLFRVVVQHEEILKQKSLRIIKNDPAKTTQ